MAVNVYNKMHSFCTRSDWILDLLKQNQRKLHAKTIVTNALQK